MGYGANRCWPARHWIIVSFVNTLDLGAGAGHAADGGVGRDPPDPARLRQLAEEQAALRRVATLVARGAAPEEVFAVVAEEVGRLLAADFTILDRYHSQDTLEIVASLGYGGTDRERLVADGAVRAP